MTIAQKKVTGTNSRKGLDIKGDGHLKLEVRMTLLCCQTARVH